MKSTMIVVRSVTWQDARRQMDEQANKYLATAKGAGNKVRMIIRPGISARVVGPGVNTIFVPQA